MLTSSKEALPERAFHRILISTRSADATRTALHLTRQLADFTGSSLFLTRKADSALGAVAAHVWRGRMIPIQTLDEDVVALRSLIAKRQIDLVFTESNDPVMFARRALNRCMAEELYRHASCPCIVIGPMALGDLPKPSPPGPVIFATNFQSQKSSTVRLAAEFTLRLGSVLQCAHVLPTDMNVGERIAHIVPELMRKALIEEAHRHGVSVPAESCQILYGSSISDSLASYAREQQASLLTLAVSKGGRQAGQSTAGVSARLLSISPCPVAVSAVDDHPESQDAELPEAGRTLILSGR